MPRKSTKISTRDLAKKQVKNPLLKKPSLEEFLKQASKWHDRWGAICTPPFDNKQTYLDYQKMFYIQNIQDLSGAEYNKMVQAHTKNVQARLNTVLENLTKKKGK